MTNFDRKPSIQKKHRNKSEHTLLAIKQKKKKKGNKQVTVLYL